MVSRTMVAADAKKGSVVKANASKAAAPKTASESSKKTAPAVGSKASAKAAPAPVQKPSKPGGAKSPRAVVAKAAPAVPTVAKPAKAAPAVPTAAKPAKAAPAVPTVAKPAKAAPAVPTAGKGVKAAAAVVKPAAKPAKAASAAGKGAKSAPAVAKPAKAAPAVGKPAKASGSSQTRVAKAPAPARKPPGGAARPGPARPGGGLGAKAESSKRVSEGYAKDERFLAGQRTALLRERATYLDQAASLKAEAEALVEEMEPGDIQFDDESGEGGTVTVDRERDLALSAQAMAAVEEIDHTLVKTDNGTYGICENCGRSIVKARLEALPYARLCIDCKSGGLSRR